MGSVSMGTSVADAARDQAAEFRLPTWTEATDSDPPTGDSHARSHYARRTHGPRATTPSVSELQSLTVRVCVASCMRTPKRLIVSLESTVRLSEKILD